MAIMYTSYGLLLPCTRRKIREGLVELSCVSTAALSQLLSPVTNIEAKDQDQRGEAEAQASGADATKCFHLLRMEFINRPALV